MTNTAATANPTNICDHCGAMYGLHQDWCPMTATCSFCSVCGLELTSVGSVCNQCSSGDAGRAALAFIAETITARNGA